MESCSWFDEREGIRNGEMNGEDACLRGSARKMKHIFLKEASAVTLALVSETGMVMFWTVAIILVLFVIVRGIGRAGAKGPQGEGNMSAS